MLEDFFPNGGQRSIPQKIKQVSELHEIDLDRLLQPNLDPEQLMLHTETHNFIKAALVQNMHTVLESSNKSVAAIVPTPEIDDMCAQKAVEINGKIRLLNQGVASAVLFDGTIQVDHISIIHSSSEETAVYYTIAVKNARKNCHFVDIPKSDYSTKAFSLVLRKCPQVTFHSIVINSIALMRDYMATLLGAADNLPVKHVFDFSGWYQTAEGWKYLHGNMPNVISTRKLPATININSDFLNFFQLAQKLLMPGQKAANFIVFLHSHMGYLARIFKEAHFSAHYILFLKGKTNAGKTSLLSELSGSIMYDNPPMARLEDTRSYLEGVISEMQDSLLLVDDAHPSPTLQGEREIKANIEVVVRAYGDSQTRGKRGADRVSLEKIDICGAVWMTGEFLHLAAQSSVLRVLQVELPANGVNKETLSILQQNKYIARQYYAGYIKYLSDNFDKLVQYFSKTLYEKRKLWRESLGTDIGRTTDIAVSLDFIAQTVQGYADYAGQNINNWNNCAQQLIQGFLSQKIIEDKESDPVAVFRNMFRALYDAGEIEIASDKKIFQSNINFIGYSENGQFVVINEIIRKNIKSKSREKGLSDSQPSIQILFEEGIASKDKAIRFSVKRANSTRPTMLYLYINKILDDK